MGSSDAIKKIIIREQIMTAIPGRTAAWHMVKDVTHIADILLLKCGRKQVQNIQKPHWWAFAVTEQV